MPTTRRPTKRVSQEHAIHLGWIEVLLATSLVSLVILLFPGFWLSLLAPLDARTWTWRGWAVASTVWIVGLVAFRAWQRTVDDH